MTRLTDKQLRALRAVAEPNEAPGQIFWADARASWPGPRKTLGSLYNRGLVDYFHGHWSITGAGLAELALHEANR